MSKNKLLICAMLLFSILMLTVACGQSDIDADNESNAEAVNESKVYVDVLGREVEISEVPERVVSLTPAATEIMFALGVEDKLVGVTEYCDYPAEALNKPKMGDFENPNIELVIDAEPDLVFVAAWIQIELVDRLEQLGSKVFVLDAETIDQVIKNIRMTGEIMGVSENANLIADDMQERVDRVLEKVKDLEKPLVFYEVWDDPLMSAGPGTFIHSLIEMAGGINMAEDTDTLYPRLSMEILVERDPDVYIANDVHNSRDIMARPGYDSLRAVQNERVYTIEDDLVTLPGPRIIMGLEKMAKIIHPEAF